MTAAEASQSAAGPATQPAATPASISAAPVIPPTTHWTEPVCAIMALANSPVAQPRKLGAWSPRKYQDTDLLSPLNSRTTKEMKRKKTTLMMEIPLLAMTRESHVSLEQQTVARCFCHSPPAQPNRGADDSPNYSASTTASLSASILEYRTFHGRTYHSLQGTADHW